MLVDKINVTFLRDSQFSNINNIFATKFLRNVSGIGSRYSFLVITDNDGFIKCSNLVKNLEKINADIKDLILKNKKDSLVFLNPKRPFVDIED